jgi:hypothetical protein
MPQPLNLKGSGGSTLLIRRPTCALLPNRPGGVVLEVEHALRVPGQRSHLGVEVRALEVKHCLKAMLPYVVLLIQIGRSTIGNATVTARRSLHREVRVMCAIISTPMSGSLPMTDPDHGTVGLKGIVMLTLHLSEPWAMDSRRQW